LTNDVTVTSS